ncbi:ABC-type glutathione transport system ATPase component [Paenibacillus forsythiae]|uniref:ABC-type glutathione transport system ATPase component n=1 Tax=Paenibacillus forsythiae TaxID=365616 RepID=A0ABU3H646_9BACL|nr:dipeptide/oligopeptide/nickel ABC transporter ATP-binding protein [Paenibacillus forsythiae]MDT3426282.1 ABC-type glutathione transport system ATPase component [Paenibacillus forsythiae]
MTEARANNIINVVNLHKSYTDAHPVLHSISFHLTEGECLGVVGESGCGKSTLARCLLTLTGWQSGEIYFDGLRLSGMGNRELREARSRMSAVFQNPASALNPRLPILDSLMEPLDERKGFVPSFLAGERPARRLEVAEALLATVGLSADALFKHPHELSGGEKQRIMIARAISTEPAFIVLDEPTASLDVTTQSVILNLLKDLQETLSLSYLFISHDLAAVHFMSDRIMVMRSGHILDEFSKSRIFDEQRHHYTKLLLEVFSG